MSGQNWPKHADGRNKKIGEMTPDERRQVANDAGRKLQAEFDDHTSQFRRGVEAILFGPVLPRTSH